MCSPAPGTGLGAGLRWELRRVWAFPRPLKRFFHSVGGDENRGGGDQRGGTTGKGGYATCDRQTCIAKKLIVWKKTVVQGGTERKKLETGGFTHLLTAGGEILRGDRE